MANRWQVSIPFVGFIVALEKNSQLTCIFSTFGLELILSPIKPKKEKAMRKSLISIILILTASMYVHGVIFCNDTPCAYGECNDENKVNGGQMTPLVINGAGYFIKSNSDFQLFLQKIELSELYGPNFDVFQDNLNNAISNVEYAIGIYNELIAVAEETPYDQLIIYKLKTFGYDDFLKGHNLNAEVFNRVRSFLVKGDVTGAYKRIKADMEDILGCLNSVKGDIDKNIPPKIATLWDVNQKYSDSLFFGQYSAMIFSMIVDQR